MKKRRKLRTLQGMIFDDFLDLWLPFGSLWLPFVTLAPFWFPLASFRLPLAPFWLPLGGNNSGGIPQNTCSISFSFTHAFSTKVSEEVAHALSTNASDNSYNKHEPTAKGGIRTRACHRKHYVYYMCLVFRSSSYPCKDSKIRTLK